MTWTRWINVNESYIEVSDQWFQVFEAASSKTEAIKQATSSMTEAKAAVKRVLETIEQGKKNEVTAQNIALQAADEVNPIIYWLQFAVLCCELVDICIVDIRSNL